MKNVMLSCNVKCGDRVLDISSSGEYYASNRGKDEDEYTTLWYGG